MTNFQYDEAASAIQNWITLHKVAPGGRIPSTRLLAKQIGFSKEATARACITLIGKGLLFRTGYKLILGKTASHPTPIEGIIYVASYWEGFIKIVRRILTERGIKYRGVILSHIKNRNPSSALSKIFAEKPAGVILWMPSWIEGLETVIEPEKTPIAICANGAPPDLNFNIIGMDLYRAVEKALKHLYDLGHRQIAFLMNANPSSSDHELIECYRTVCLKLNLKQSASNIWSLKSRNENKELKTLQKHRERHPEVTALLGVPEIIQLPQKTAQVPNELSVICCYDFNGSENNKPSITTVGIPVDGERAALWACNEIVSLIQTMQLGLPRKHPNQTLVVPSLTIRGSTKAIVPKDQDSSKIQHKADTPPRRISPWESWRKSYPSLQKGDHHWKQLDLTGLANHSMTQENGWLGKDPLLYFTSGARMIHGVPFEVIQEKRNRGKSVITFQSPHTHSSGKNKLPSSVELPVHDRVQALYFLHGCGWVEEEPFAEYIIHFKTKKSVKIPLIPIGLSKTPSRKRSASLLPNIQDWWHEFKPQDFAHAMYATVFNPENPQEYERTLYTLEWINPRPKDEVSFIEVKVDPKAGPALALIAVTALQ